MQLRTSIPEKWAILRTPDNYKMVNEWANNNLGGSYTTDVGYVHSQMLDSLNSVNKALLAGYTLLTDIEFRCLVLGQKLSVTDLKENECIHASTKEEDRQIRELFNKEGWRWNGGSSLLESKNNHTDRVLCPYPDEKVITHSNRQGTNRTIYPASYFITTNQSTMDKEIIGYVLKPEYSHVEEAVCRIALEGSVYSEKTAFSQLPDNTSKTQFAYNSLCAQNLQKAGVLQLWFTPVYKKEDPSYSIGDWVTVVTPDEIDLSGGYPKGYTFQIGAEFNSGTHIRPHSKCNGIEKTSVRPATKEEIASSQTVTLTLGDKKTKVTIRKGSIEAEGNTVKIDHIKRIQVSMNYTLATGNMVNSWHIEMKSVKIGCCTFTKEEIDQIINTYNTFHKIPR